MYPPLYSATLSPRPTNSYAAPHTRRAATLLRRRPLVAGGNSPNPPPYLSLVMGGQSSEQPVPPPWGPPPAGPPPISGFRPQVMGAFGHGMTLLFSCRSFIIWEVSPDIMLNTPLLTVQMLPASTERWECQMWGRGGRGFVCLLSLQLFHASAFETTYAQNPPFGSSPSQDGTLQLPIAVLSAGHRGMWRV